MALSLPRVAAPAVELPTIPLRDALPWAAFAAVTGMALLYFVGIEQSAVSMFAGSWVHEFVHDARHLAGLPCH
jgi:cobalt transporter subunit CbtB